MLKIIQQDNPILREVAKEVPLGEIDGEKIKKILADMSSALEKCEDGVALAAPQIGISLRIFVVSPKAFTIGKEQNQDEKTAAAKTKEETNKLIYINPTITRKSSKKNILEEGCLSVRGIFGKIQRHEKVTITARDEHGQKFTRGASGLLAEIFQHETDHLNGTLFTDTATNLTKIENKDAPRAQKFVFFGTPEFAVDVLDELERGRLVPNLVITNPDEPKGRRLIVTPPPVKIWATERGIPVLQPKSLKTGEVDDVLKAVEADLFIVAAYGKIIPEAIIDLPRYGTINIHPSLLPKYRGASPVQTAILNGDAETGVSIMLIDKEMDHGPIIAQEKVEIDGSYLPELKKQLAKTAGRLLIKILPDWVSGKIKAIPQDHSSATFTQKINKEDGFVDSGDILSDSLSAERATKIERMVRARSPDPGVFTIFDVNKRQLRVKITRAKIQDGKLVIEKVIPEGKKEMAWEDFKRGNKI